MTGLPELNFPAFAAMTANLRADGHTVTNPAELNPDGGSWNDCTLPGWQDSRGASLEVHIGKELGMKVVNAHDLVARENAAVPTFSKLM